MDYAVWADTAGTVQHHGEWNNGNESEDGGEDRSATAHDNTSRRGSQDFMSDDGTLVASEHNPRDGQSDGGMSTWIARELESHYNNATTTITDGNNDEAGVDDGAANGEAHNHADQTSLSPATSPTGTDCHPQESSTQHHEQQQAPSASSLGKRSRENSGLDGETLAGDGSPPSVLAQGDAGETSSSPSQPPPSSDAKCKGKAAKKAKPSRPEPNRRITRSHTAMAPPPPRRPSLEYGRAPSPQPLESPHAVQVQPREGIPKHLFAGSFEKDFRDAFARPKPADQANRDDIAMKIATGELDGASGPSTAAPAAASESESKSASSSTPDPAAAPAPAPVEQPRPARPAAEVPYSAPPTRPAPVRTSAPATATTATAPPAAHSQQQTDPGLHLQQYSVQNSYQPGAAGHNAAQNLHDHHHQHLQHLQHPQHYHHHGPAQHLVQQAEMSPLDLNLGVEIHQPMQAAEAAPRSLQAIHSYQSMQAMHAMQAAQEMQTMQELQSMNAYSAMQGLPGMPVVSPDAHGPVPTTITAGTTTTAMPPMAPPVSHHHNHQNQQHSPSFENTTAYVGYNFRQAMLPHVVTEVVDEYTVGEYYEVPDMVVTGMGMVDFANPEEISQMMGGVDGQEPVRALHTSQFYWPSN
ncbi:hypothetical protein SCUCBS95973_004787 [Sporothrix curviconia]|uniref:Uncharacterized protein n=1 Tax=Sporothrix curviconia TaxID=1260050 RepID=A0ABP0BRN3_9PEZI